MSISVIVCTKNRCASLAACLEHLSRVEASADDWELIVVDNGSTDGTEQIVNSFVRRVPFDMRLVNEPRRGLAVARSTGIAAATGGILAFTDDDCYVSPQFLASISRVFQDESLGFIGGRVVLYDPTDDPITTKDEEHPFTIPPFTFIEAGLMHGCNMAVRREVIAAIGGFDPLLGAGAPFRCGEDVDLFARASAAGWAGAYCPSVVVHHHHGRKPGKDVDALMRGYDFGRGAYYAKCLLRREIRHSCIRHLYWSVRGAIRRRCYGQLVRECNGALWYWMRPTGMLSR
jgi:glycosyltransferase involved in cell wall biosynthesis